MAIKKQETTKKTTTDKQGTTKTKKKASNKKQETKKRKFRWYYVIPIIFVILVIILVYVVFGSSSSDGPVYGRRCEVEIEITDAQIDSANSVLSGVTGLTEGSVELDCLTLKVYLTFDETITLDQAKSTATSLVQQIDSAIGYEKLTETDTYSKIFSDNGEDRMYDIQISITSSTDSYSSFGYKHYQSQEITYTDSTVKDQDLVNELYEEQYSDTTEESTAE